MSEGPRASGETQCLNYANGSSSKHRYALEASKDWCAGISWAQAQCALLSHGHLPYRRCSMTLQGGKRRAKQLERSLATSNRPRRAPLLLLLLLSLLLPGTTNTVAPSFP